MACDSIDADRLMSRPFKVPATSIDALALDKATKVDQLLDFSALRLMSPAL